MTLTRAYWPRRETSPIRNQTVGDLIRDATAAAPDRDALVAGMPDPAARRRWTHAELLADAERTAQALLTEFEPGDHVAVFSPNLPEWVILELAMGLAGLVLVTVNPAYRPGELRFVLGQSRARGIFYAHAFRGNPMAEAVDTVARDLPSLGVRIPIEELAVFAERGDAAQALPDVDPSSPAQIQYTSGTTGFPKGALLHHRGIVNNARLTAECFEVHEGDVWLNPMPLFHTGGCVLAALGALAVGATHVPVYVFDPALVLELIETERVGVMGAVPTMLIAMREHADFLRRDLSSVRNVLSGGSTVPAQLVRELEEDLGVRFGIVFGQTEASPVITQTRLDDSPEDKAETIGQPQPQQDVKVVDPTSGQVAGVGELGEICTRGYNVMLGYFELDDATKEAIDEDGWLHTGDLGSMDSRGYLTIQGRLKDMLIRGGENIYPREIEDVLLTHPAVAEVAVLGVPDTRWGEEVAAVIRLTPGAAPVGGDELHAYVRSRLAPQKAPRIWSFVDEFPLTASGKIQKFVLRDELTSERRET